VAAVLYGRGVWSPILREERTLCLFEIIALRKIFVSKAKEVTGDWRKLCSDKPFSKLGGGACATCG
jgi:hypothetical protein